MNLARVSSNGQITAPIEIRRLYARAKRQSALGARLREGDKVLFVQRENGDVVIGNASASAIMKAQQAFSGVAENMGVQNESDVQALVNEVRYGKRS